MTVREVIVPLSTRSAPRDTLARPMRDLRISVMDRCNFRCPYCMPRETYHEQYRFLGSHERLSFDEIVRLARHHGTLVVHDFAYADLGFDGYQPPSILQVEGAKEIAVATAWLGTWLLTVPVPLRHCCGACVAAVTVNAPPA